MSYLIWLFINLFWFLMSSIWLNSDTLSRYFKIIEGNILLYFNGPPSSILLKVSQWHPKSLSIYKQFLLDRMSTCGTSSYVHIGSSLAYIIKQGLSIYDRNALQDTFLCSSLPDKYPHALALVTSSSSMTQRGAFFTSYESTFYSWSLNLFWRNALFIPFAIKMS